MPIGLPWKDTDIGLCSYRGGYFPTAECRMAKKLKL
jgi:hypothetical protein